MFLQPVHNHEEARYLWINLENKFDLPEQSLDSLSGVRVASAIASVFRDRPIAMNSILNSSWSARCSSPVDKLVLVNLADRANAAGKCWPGMSTIRRDTELSKRTIIRCLARLELAGHIEIIRRQGDNNYYIVHPKSPSATVSPVTRWHATSASKPPPPVTQGHQHPNPQENQSEPESKTHKSSPTNFIPS